MQEPNPFASIKTPWKLAAPPPGLNAGGLASVSIPDHTLIRQIGKGSYGEVWLARNILGVFRAVKIVHRRAFENDRPFERELAGIQRFEPVSRTHESQLNILHVGRGAECFYYVMELADDMGRGPAIDEASYTPRTLRSELLLHGRLPIDECLRLGLALTTALGHLHRHGLVHRDIKPSNIIYVNGIPKLADIGLVAQAEATMSFVGTEGYLPPEGPGTPQADLFSLGKVLYEISTGRDRQEFPELPTDVQELPDRGALAEFNEVLVRACAPDVKQRYQTAAEMHADLALLQSGKSVSRMRAVERRLKLVVRAGAVVTALATTIAAGWLWQARQTHKVRELAAEKATLAEAAEAEEFKARQNLYAADMSLAYHALERGNLGQVRQLLAKYSPQLNVEPGTNGKKDLRGWEWRSLWQRSRGEETAVLAGHSNVVTFAGMLPDGRTVVSVGRDRTVRFWDLKTRRLLEAVGCPDEPWTGALSPDGRWLAVGGEQGCWSLWDTTSRTLQFARTNSSSVRGLAFSWDSAHLAVASNRALEVWNVHGFRFIAELARVNRDFRVGLAFSPDGKTLAYSQGDEIIATNSLMLWDLETGNRTFLGTLQVGGALGLAFSPNSRSLICGERSGISVWDVPTRSLQKRLSNHTEHVISVALSPNGKLLASTGADQTVRLWETESWEETRVLRGHEREVHSVAFSADGRKVLSSGKDEIVRVWDTEAKPSSGETYTCPRGWRLMPDQPNTPRQLRVQVGTGEQTGIGFLDLTRCEEIGTQPSPIPFSKGQYPDDVSADLSKIAILKTNGAIEIWGTMPLAKHKVIDPSVAAGRTIAFSSTGSWLAVERSDGNIEILDLVKDRPSVVLDKLPLQGLNRIYYPPLSFWAQDTRFVRVIRQSDDLTESVDILLFPGTESKRIRMTHKDVLNNFALSSDGRLLATCAWDGEVKLWDIISGREIFTFTGQLIGYISLAFSPDASRLAAGGWDGSVTLWDLSSFSQVAHWKAHTHYAIGVCFLDGGDTLMTRGSVTPEFGNWETHVWRPPSFAAIQAAERVKAYRAE